MPNKGPLPPTVQSAAVRVCWDALHWRDDLRALFTSAGVPVSLHDRYDIPGNSKAKIARAVFSTLQDCGESGCALQRKVVEELCRMTKQSPDAPDQRAGKEALVELKREATAAKVLVDPERVAADARRAASQRKTAATEARRERIGELRKLFIDLNQLKPSSTAERQACGYRLERLLADLFRAYDIDYRPSYKVEDEQIDGSFHFRGFTYLVEARWRPGSSGPRGAPRAPHDLRCHQRLSSDCLSSQTGMMPAAALTFPAYAHPLPAAPGPDPLFLSGHSRDLQQHTQG